MHIQASILALAGKFDSTVLPTTAMYLGISEVTEAEDQSDTHTNNVEDYNYNEEELENNEATLMNDERDQQQNRCITAFSSGTGLAGIVGYGYKAFLSEVFGWGLSYIVWSAIGFAFFYWQIYHTGLDALEQERMQPNDTGNFTQQAPPIHMLESSLLVTGRSNNEQKDEGYDNASLVEMVGHHQHRESRNTTSAAHRILSSASANTDLTAHDRFKLVLSLWPYTIPLFTVYAAEYMLQAGVWSAIGFPVTSTIARAQFYHNANWTVSLASMLLPYHTNSYAQQSVRSIISINLVCFYLVHLATCSAYPFLYFG